MRTMTRNVLVGVTSVAIIGLAASAQAISAPIATSLGATSVTVAGEVSDSLEEQLRFTMEEERMARDLYAALAEVHDGARPMSRITVSEQHHMDHVGTLLEKYDITDPSSGLDRGELAFPELQTLYDRWLAEGSESIEAAYQVGIELEERDIADLTAMIEDTDVEDVRVVLERLRTASERHLDAFARAADGTVPGGPGACQGPGMENRGPHDGRRHGQHHAQHHGQGNGSGPQAGSVPGYGPAAGTGDCPRTVGDDTTT